MNIKLQHGLSDVTGVSGMVILKAILSGERDSQKLAQLRERHCQQSEAEIARALQGTWQAEPLLAVQQAVELSEFSHQQITACDRQSAAHLQRFGDKSAGQVLPYRPRKRKRRATEPRLDARPPRLRLAGVELTAIEGLDENTALVLLSAIGTDLSRWPTEKHFAAWLGLCPHHQISGGKVLSRKVRPSANRAATALRLARPVPAPQSPCPRGVLPALEGAAGSPQGHHRHRSQTRAPRVSPPEVWRSLCGPRHGGVRASLP